jgi:hypothetical protein
MARHYFLYGKNGYGNFKIICFAQSLYDAILFFLQNNPILKYESLLFDEANPELNVLFAEAFQYLKRAVIKWPGDNELLIEKLENVYATWFAKGQTAYKDIGEFSVLNHADFHFKNVMFKYNGEKLEDILLVGKFWVCSSVKNLVYFFLQILD